MTGDEPYTDAEVEAGAAAVDAEWAVHDGRAYARLVLDAVLPQHAARIRREVAAAAEHKWRVSTSRELGREVEDELRINAATAIIQSGYEDQDEDDPDAWDLVVSTACTDCPSPTRRCGCSGVPWLHERAWSTLGAVFAEHARQVRADSAEQIAQALLARDPAEWALAGQHAGEDAAAIARAHTTAPEQGEEQRWLTFRAGLLAST